MYKLLAVDMDGTLLKEDKTISEENIAAIESAKRQGIKVVLATGRPLHGINNYLSQLNLIDENNYAVTCNGALVQNTKTGHAISKSLMTIDDIKYLYKLSIELGVGIHAFVPGSVITPPDPNKYIMLECKLNDVPLNIVDFNTLDPNTEVIKVLFTGKPKILAAAVDKLPKDITKKYNCMFSAPFFYEFLSKNSNKGVGVALLAESLSIKPEEVICIGDAGNDVHMIKYAGLGVAMGNAFPEAKAVADYVTKTNEEHGVANVINKFILEKSCKAAF